MIKRSKKISIFDIINNVFMLLIIFVTAYPIYYTVIASISDPKALSLATEAIWLPLKPYTLDAYKAVFANPLIASGFRNTAFILVVGLALNLALTTTGAYFLCIKGPMLKTPITFMIIFTMYFGGGLVPSYLNIKDLGLLNSIWSLIIPVGLSTSNLIIMKSAFQSLPDSLVESAKLDGAKHIQILLRIMIPLSKATLAVMVLYYGVSHWNSWFSASIYLRDSNLFPIQLVMHNILSLSNVGDMATGVGMDEASQYMDLIKYALIVVTTTPILALYPFLQKYFVKGVMVGAIKG